MCHECELDAGKITRHASAEETVASPRHGQPTTFWSRWRTGRDHLDGAALPDPARRRLVLGAGAAVATAGLLSTPAVLAETRVARALAPSRRQGRGVRSLRFFHTHTGERLKVTYAEDGEYLPDALDEISHLLRDFRSGDVHPIDPGTLDILYHLRQQMGGSGTYQVISAFRSPATNDMLRSRGSAVARRSLHMDGRAIDVRLTGVETRRLREAALKLKAGGVGYYPRSDFLHVDTGRVRTW